MAKTGVDNQPLKEGNATGAGGDGASFASTGSASGRKQKTTGTEELVRSIISGTDDDNMSQFLCLRCPGNVMVLLLTTFLFALITAVQYGFAKKGHVDALISDCRAMFCDTLSYFLNIFAELSPRQYKRKLQLVIPVISLSVLTVLVVIDFLDALQSIKCENLPETPGCDVDPNPPSILTAFVFGFVGLIFDIISIYAFWRNRQRAKSEEGGLPVNMLAAFMHVGADFIRSATTTVESFVLWGAPGINGNLVDAYCCVVIDVTIGIGILFGLFEVARDVRVYLRTGE